MQDILNKHLLFLLVFFYLAACNQESDKQKEQPTVSSSDTIKNKAGEPEVMTIAGKLDTLWVSMAQFDALPDKKVVFLFTFGERDTLTMHGWTLKRNGGDEYDDPPNIKLLKGKAGPYSYGPGTYFGNLVLTDINKIKKQLGAGGASYVLFAPEKDGQHVRYKVFGSREDPTLADKILALIPTSGEANPSPPKSR
jgi:hypothetical protein